MRKNIFPTERGPDLTKENGLWVRVGLREADTAREIAGRGLTRYKNRAAFITADSLVL